MAQLVRAPARRAGDPGSNPGPGENFSLKVLLGIIDKSTNIRPMNSFIATALYTF